MRVCKNCERSNTPDLCKVGGASDKCVECARKSYPCDLAPFSPARWARIRRQRDAKLQEWKDAQARVTRIAAELGLLEREEREMVEGELQNIEEVERDEQNAGPDKSPSVDDFLFDLSSEQVQLPDNWEKLLLDSSVETSAKP